MTANAPTLSSALLPNNGAKIPVVANAPRFLPVPPVRSGTLQHVPANASNSNATGPTSGAPQVAHAFVRDISAILVSNGTGLLVLAKMLAVFLEVALTPILLTTIDATASVRSVLPEVFPRVPPVGNL